MFKGIGLIITAGLIGSAVAENATVTVDFAKRFQTIDNFGSSTGMHGTYIAKYWKPSHTEQIAKLLFSRETDVSGRPEGIGLTAFRIEIGAGTDTPDSGIAKEWRKTRLFLQEDGSYDWNVDPSVRFWLEQIKKYEVPTAIGYLNSPPVCWTENGLGYRTNEVFSANLKDEHYADYAEFLTRIASHFDDFDYIAPVNEPQWFWAFPHGSAKQEGSPWTNEQIARLVRLTDAAFHGAGVQARLLIPEAADYPPLYEKTSKRHFEAASDQINAFWNRQSPDFVGDLVSLAPIAAGHAYFSDVGLKAPVTRRERLWKTIEDTDKNLRFWQTEYSLLGDGWQDGKEPKSLDEVHCALFLARMIHWDLTVANASAWQFWSSTEPEHNNANPPRFCLIETDRNGAERYTETKLLWALGQFSRFITPGMVRIQTDIRPDTGPAGVLVSAYCDLDRQTWTLAAINMTSEETEIGLKLKNVPFGMTDDISNGYITDSRRNMAPMSFRRRDKLTLPPRSIVTVISN